VTNRKDERPAHPSPHSKPQKRPPAVDPYPPVEEETRRRRAVLIDAPMPELVLEPVAERPPPPMGVPYAQFGKATHPAIPRGLAGQLRRGVVRGRRAAVKVACSIPEAEGTRALLFTDGTVREVVVREVLYEESRAVPPAPGRHPSKAAPPNGNAMSTWCQRSLLAVTRSVTAQLGACHAEALRDSVKRRRTGSHFAAFDAPDRLPPVRKLGQGHTTLKAQSSNGRTERRILPELTLLGTATRGGVKFVEG
jgi:hypothetical protein